MDGGVPVMVMSFVELSSFMHQIKENVLVFCSVQMTFTCLLTPLVFNFTSSSFIPQAVIGCVFLWEQQKKIIMTLVLNWTLSHVFTKKNILKNQCYFRIFLLLILLFFVFKVFLLTYEVEEYKHMLPTHAL